MGDVLAGNNAVWEFAPDALVIRYSRSVRGSRLLQALGERRVPYTALESVEVADGRRGTVVLRAVPRPGADPVVEAAAGQLRETADPYRLVLPEQSRSLAEARRDELTAAIGALGPAEPPARFLVAAPAGPRSFKAYDAKAFFDGRTVTFRWFWTGASTAKWKAGDQSFPVEELDGVEWHSPNSSTATCGSAAGTRPSRPRRPTRTLSGDLRPRLRPGPRVPAVRRRRAGRRPQVTLRRPAAPVPRPAPTAYSRAAEVLLMSG